MDILGHPVYELLPSGLYLLLLLFLSFSSNGKGKSSESSPLIQAFILLALLAHGRYLHPKVLFLGLRKIYH
jgi:hypothetical protein